MGDGCQSVGRKDEGIRIRPKERWFGPQSVKYLTTFWSVGMKVGMLLKPVGLINRMVGLGTLSLVGLIFHTNVILSSQQLGEGVGGGGGGGEP